MFQRNLLFFISLCARKKIASNYLFKKLRSHAFNFKNYLHTNFHNSGIRKKGKSMLNGCLSALTISFWFHSKYWSALQGSLKQQHPKFFPSVVQCFALQFRTLVFWHNPTRRNQVGSSRVILGATVWGRPGQSSGLFFSYSKFMQICV